MSARAVLLALALAGTASAQQARWAPAWGSAQMLVAAKDAAPFDAAGPATVREVVHLLGGGARLRVRLSNAYGDQPLVIGAAALGRSAPGSDRSDAAVPLTFNGARRVVIPAGAELYADPVALPTRPGDDLAVSLFLPEPVTHRTGHPGARATTYLAKGDQTGAAALPGAAKIGGWWSLADVEVTGGTQTGAIVAIGDSITDGHGVRDDVNRRWPDDRARRLLADPATRGLSVVNAGIGGNHVLTDGLGPNLLARFDRDVLARPNVRYALVLEGVNDLGGLTREHPVSAAEHQAMVAALEGAFREIAARAHAHSIKLIGGTITPYVGGDYYHPAPVSEADRQAANAFIRTSGTFDSVVDFDRAVRDPSHPDRLFPAYDSGDHLHPSEAGYQAMADAIPLTLFGSHAAHRAVAGPVARPLIALTFDDMPAHGPLPLGGDRLRVAQDILAALQAHHAPAFGFVTAGFGAGEAESPRVLAAWRAAGLPLGNHTYSHPNLDAIGAPAFLADLRRDAPIVAATMPGQDWRWFRYPYLSEGTDPSAREAVRAGLRADGYRVAAVTMSFGDYAWNDAYARCVARHDDAAIAALERSYLAAARAQAERSRTLARDALGHDIPYVLLMHLGAFDARMLPRLLTLYEGMGFGFTTLPAAEADPFYAAALDLARPGPSPTLEAAARAAGVPVPPNAPLPDASVCA